MTDVLDALIKKYSDQLPHGVHIETYTAPSGPPSIDNDDDALMSTKAVMADLQFRFEEYDAYLVTCYSVHPLVGMLKARVSPRIHVTGIFEASILTALSLLPLDSDLKFGIISTGTFWEKALTLGVDKLCGSENSNNKRLKGVETIGLNASDLHDTDAEEVKIKVQRATKRLVRDKDVRVICLGCATMAGLYTTVAEALKEELGEKAQSVYIVDGVLAGLCQLETLIREVPAKSL